MANAARYAEMRRLIVDFCDYLENELPCLGDLVRLKVDPNRQHVYQQRDGLEKPWLCVSSANGLRTLLAPDGSTVTINVLAPPIDFEVIGGAKDCV
jgi:hypothetical protein